MQVQVIGKAGWIGSHSVKVGPAPGTPVCTRPSTLLDDWLAALRLPSSDATR